VDYEYLCTNLGHLMGLPVRIYRKDKLLCHYSNVAFFPDPAELIQDKVIKSHHHAAYFDQHMLFFGMVRVPVNKVTIVIGPAFSVKPGKEQIHILLRELGVPLSRLREFSYYIDTIPTYPIESFLHIICFINYYLNKEKLTVSDLIAQATNSVLPKPNSELSYETGDESKVHNTYQMERELLSYISAGKTESLKKLFSEPPTGRVGKLAHDELRQEKNTFVCSATLSSRAAIGGGLSHEIAFSLSDYYIQKAELLSEYNAIARLNMEMLLEFAKRVEELNFNGSRSKYVVGVSRYVNRNLNNRITLSELSLELGINRTYLCEVFKSEVGMTINEFITQQKIKEAKRLLKFTGRSISAISESLSFSSQCYFQNVFKKATGETPNQYRAGNESNL